MSERNPRVLDYPITYRGYTFNPHRLAPPWDEGSDGYNRAWEQDTIRVSHLDFSPLAVRDQIEGRHLDTGALAGPATKEFRRLALRGEVVGSTPAAFEDRCVRLTNVLDPEEAQRTDPLTRGFSALDFYTPTDEPPIGFDSPVHEMFLARPHGYPVIYERLSRGLTGLFAAELVCEDPRRYLVDETTVIFDDGAGWTQTCPNWELGQGVVVWPVVSVDITRGDTSYNVTVDMATGLITLEGEPAAQLRTSDVDTLIGIPPSGSDITISEDEDPLAHDTFISDGTTTFSFERIGSGDTIASATVTYRMARS